MSVVIQPALGIIGSPHGKGELVVMSGPQGCGKALRRAELLKKLPPGSKFSVHEWPYHCTTRDITRDLNDGLFVFVETTETNLERFPIRPYKLISLTRQRSRRKAA